MKRAACFFFVIVALVVGLSALAEVSGGGVEAQERHWFPLILSSIIIILLITKVVLEWRIIRHVKEREVEEKCWYEKRTKADNPQKAKITCTRTKEDVGIHHVRCARYSPVKYVYQDIHSHPLYHYVSIIDYSCTVLLAFVAIVISLQ